MENSEILTTELVPDVFPKKESTLNCLFYQSQNSILEMLYLFRETVNVIDKGVNLRHCVDELEYFFISIFYRLGQLSLVR